MNNCIEFHDILHEHVPWQPHESNWISRS